MSLEQERQAIEAYFTAAWPDTAIGLIDQPFTPPVGVDGRPTPSIRLSVQNGSRRQSTIGGAQNVVTSIAVLQVQLMTDGALGRASWASYADTIIALLDRKTLDAAGNDILTTGTTAFVRFSPPELGDNAEPYIAATQDDAPFRVVTINAPFVRYDLR